MSDMSQKPISSLARECMEKPMEQEPYGYAGCGYGWWFYLFWFLIIGIIVWFLLFALKPDFVQKDDDDLFAAGEREKLGHELRSIKRILKESYEKREKKIINIALNKSRTKSDIIDLSAMLKEEKDFYEQLIKLLDGYRNGILMSLFKGEVPFFQKPNIDSKSFSTGEVLNPTESSNFRTSSEVKAIIPENEDNKTSTYTESKNEEKTEEKPELKKIRFIHPVPSFVWKDLKDYGPFEAGEETEIFPEVADLIIEKGRAEEV